MSKDEAQSGRIAFEGFVLDTRSLELWLGEERVPLAPKPARILRELTLRAGELVTREELYEVGWGDTVVTLDVSLNTAVREIRRALGDRADAPLFVQTVPRRGYRFVAAVVAAERWYAPAARAVTSALPRRWTGALASAAAAIVLAFLVSPEPTVAVEPVFLGFNGDPATGQVLEARMRAEMASRSGGDYALLAEGGAGGRWDTADFLVRSRLQGSGGSSWFTVEIVRAESGEVVWGGAFNPDCPSVEDPTGFIARYVAAKAAPRNR
ncbi:MAG: hypothetical protein HKN73_12170 [Gemmatimonadetes bacterium]|nr:hypothetical protein [Gemmatimonadota bacterium]